MENLVGIRRPLISRETALNIRKDFQEGMTWKALSEKYKLYPPTISAILKGTHRSLRGEA